MSHTTGTTGSERTIGQLVADASRDLSALVRAEIALAKAEITTEVKQGAIGAGLFVGAAVFGGIGGLFVLLAIAWLLSEWLPTWAGFLIVAVVLLVIAGALAFVGKSRIGKVGKPERTISTSKQSIEALKGHR